MECSCAPSRSVGLPSGGVDTPTSAFVLSLLISFVSFNDLGIANGCGEDPLSRCERSSEP